MSENNLTYFFTIYIAIKHRKDIKNKKNYWEIQ